MAAQVAFKGSIENPRLDFEINCLGTFNLLEAFEMNDEYFLFKNCPSLCSNVSLA